MIANQLMALIEAGSNRSDPDRAQLMLAWGYPERDWKELASMAVGKRDNLLFKLRQKLFGNSAKLSCQCPQCAAAFEFDIAIDEILSVDTDNTQGKEITLVCDGYKLCVRALSGRDLAALPLYPEEREALKIIAKQAIVSVTDKTGKTISIPAASKIKQGWITAISKVLSEADPLSVVAFGLACADCNYEWRAFLDAVQLLWSELEVENAATLDEVHLLAKNYGWQEADIVAIPQGRRRAYVRKLMEQTNG